MLHNTPLGSPKGLLKPIGDLYGITDTSTIKLCEVQDAVAYAHSYVVKPIDGPRMPAVGASSMSNLPVGARDTAMYTPGTLVLCWVSPELPTAVILGSIAQPMGDRALALPDAFVLGSNAGIFADPAHYTPLTQKDGSGMYDVSSGRPVDNLPGDWGVINELGVGTLVGKLMALLRASDVCKVEAHYADHLLRIFGYNYQHYTAGSETEALNDEGEWTEVRSFTPFPDESLGVTSGAAFSIENSNPFDDPDIGGVEPTGGVNQVGLWRYREMNGYLGDLKRSYVLLPNPVLTEPMVYGRDIDAPAYIGLSEVVHGLDGSIALRSAKGILLEKTVWIPAPEDKQPRDSILGNDSEHPEDPTTDFGVVGAVDYATGVEFSSVEDKNAHSDDKHAYTKQRYLQDGLTRRDKDWNVEDDEKILPFKDEQAPLAPYSTQSQPLPDNTVLAISPDRNTRYYKGKAFVDITDDGGVILQDAYGSTINMSGGNIEISCPGDFVVRTGRTAQTWAGKDVITKAHDDIDISAANGDVRVKAEKNLMMLGGNHGSLGGVLIENRASGSPSFTATAAGRTANVGGLVLKSSRGTVGIYGNRIYNRSTSNQGITLDSNEGDGTITMYGSELTKVLKREASEIIAPTGDASDTRRISVVTHKSGSLEILSGALNIGASAFTMLNHRGDGPIATSVNWKANIFVEGTASATSGFNPEPADIDTAQFSSAKNTDDASVAQAKQDVTNKFGQDFDTEAAFGNEDTFEPIGVSFRDSSEFPTLAIYETDWQRRFRLTSGVDADGTYTGPVWAEPLVYRNVTVDGTNNESTPTRPYPGNDAWTGNAFYKVDPEFVTNEDGALRPKARGEKGVNYDTITGAPAVVDSLEDNYPINNV